MVALQFRRGQVVHSPTTSTPLPAYIHPARESHQSASWSLQYPRPMQTYHPEGGSRAGGRWTSSWDDKDKVYAPYPKWVTILARGLFAVFELAVVGYLANFWRGLKRDGSAGAVPVKGLDAGVGDAVFALLVDILACVAAFLGRYGWWRLWICTMLTDMAIGGLGMYAVVNLSADKDPTGQGSREEGSQRSAMLVLVMSIAHIISALGGAVGCFLVWNRRHGRGA